MKNQATVPERREKGATFVPKGNEPLFAVASKPHIVLFGHGSSACTTRRIADGLRNHARPSSYISTDTNTPTIQDMRTALQDAEMLFVSIGAESLTKNHHASVFESNVIELTGEAEVKIPLALILAHPQALLAPTVTNYGSSVLLVLCDVVGNDNGFHDIFPHAIRLPLKTLDFGNLGIQVKKLARPRMRM